MENDYGVNGERTIMLLAAAAIVSLLIHGVLVVALSDRHVSTFSSRARASERAREQRRRVPMTVTDAKPPPAADERKVRVEEKSVAIGKGPSARPDVPASQTLRPEDNRPDVPPPPPTLVGESILEVTAPTVPDDRAALPRVEVPKVARMTGAPEPDSGALVKPIRETLSNVQGVSHGTDGIGSLPVPPAPGGAAGGGSGGGAALAAALDATASDAARKAKAAKKPTAKPLPPPTVQMREKVDEAVVAAEREAVRTLRDEQEGKSFSRFVRTQLASWVDPVSKTRYFRLTLSSDDRDPLPVVSKDIVFLLDASGSISGDRLRACRNAVKVALRALNTGDRFNLVAFRDKFQYAFPAWQNVTEDVLEKSDDWLSSLTAHGRTDVFATLKSVMAVPRAPARPLVALMVTDGEPTSGLRRNEEIISSFAKLNGGIVSVYMYGVKETANEYLMDMVSRGNRGGWTKHRKALFADRAKAADEMPAFLTTFRDPVLTDLSVRFSAASRAEAYPTLVRNLYRGAPVEIVGKCPADQTDVVFEVKGLNGTDAHEDVFKLSFAGSAPADAALARQWDTLRGYEWKIR